MKRITALLLLLVAALPLFAQDKPAAVEAAELGSTANVHKIGDLWTAGQFAPTDIAEFTKQGITTVISLRQPGELDWDEQSKLDAVDIEFIELGFREPATLTDEVFDALRQQLGAAKGPLLLHCGSANRVGGAWLPYRVLDEGVALDVALAEAKTVGLRNAGYEAQALAYIERELKRTEGQEQSVKKGINDSFKNPELDVDSYVSRFEVESREVYSAQAEVMQAMNLKPGMTIADVGAGTGLYTLPFVEAVGSDGWVYAVDIAPRFLQHIQGRASKAGLTNYSAVLCTERSITLPPASVDLIYVCDTYHHFEFPQSTLASMKRALKPGGRLIVLDFERIEGVSREWCMDHVRAGKEVFRAEIESAGFKFAREVDLPGLEENYFLEFTR